LVIDYLQIMSSAGENRTQEIGAISRGLKVIAKEFDVPIIALSQLSRKVEDRQDRRPVMSDLRESGEIEQDADLVMFIYRDEVYRRDSKDAGMAEIICRKNRHGPTGFRKFSFNGEVTRFGHYEGIQSDGYDENWAPRRGGFSLAR
jgi:replicative DNA helicase